MSYKIFATAIIIISFLICDKEAQGKEPETVKIGTQVWMKKNLDVPYYSNGQKIRQCKTAKEWVEAGEKKEGVWCYYNNDPKNGKIYGKLFNWYAVNDTRGLAPYGWHIPSQNEWNVLEEFLGKNGCVGSKIKESGTSHWHYPNEGETDEGATNESNFTALPSGCRLYENSEFKSLGYEAYFWTATEFDNRYHKEAFGRHFSYDKCTISRTNSNKRQGFSVRCIKN